MLLPRLGAQGAAEEEVALAKGKVVALADGQHAVEAGAHARLLQHLALGRLVQVLACRGGVGWGGVGWWGVPGLARWQACTPEGQIGRP